jgi:hypothetical protein
MTTRTLLLGIPFLSIAPALYGQSLEKAEVRIPYAELKELLTRAEHKPEPLKPAVIAPALLAARLRVSFEGNFPVIDADFRTASFSNDARLIPLIAGDVSLEKQDPQDAAIIISEESLNLAVYQSGVRTLKLRLLPVIVGGTFRFSLPPCPSAILEVGEIAEDQSITLCSGDKEEALTRGQVRPLCHNGAPLVFRLLDPQETHEARRPPEPSEWTWQHQALVTPSDDGLVYLIMARASASSGSGVAAALSLPSDARDVVVVGEDLVSQVKTRGENRAHAVSLVWKTRGILDRQVMIGYRMPLRPLDRTWHLEAPGGEGTLTRFIIATSPLLAYSAKGLSDPLTPQGLAPVLADSLKGMTCRILEATATADLTIQPVPVAATAEGVANEARWSLKIEPDGAMLATGSLIIEHKGLLDFAFDTPEGMKLLSCELEGKSVSPVDLGDGNLKVPLPPHGGNSKLSFSFTGRTAPLDPVEGTVMLSLPKVPLFIHTLGWVLDLPAGYQAETQGNLTRSKISSGDNPSRISLVKNLCRDERPEIHVFYQRAGINR